MFVVLRCFLAFFLDSSPVSLVCNANSVKVINLPLELVQPPYLHEASLRSSAQQPCVLQWSDR
ncbi:hypothetical protein AG1IA_10296 [Rhizoctonia solani AG-1 IA]|uniref:Secreted protein n=1 Tax=Thanatephorus cucumeris (strain AG1-IA) TaxID=983506 RepID=L8WH11_THACA|nr:hypothetical protein AG1IA_10296 [Rhizoctonia solani AG-1 IA]